MGSLLDPQRQLLCEIVDAVRAAHPDNPQLRVTSGGRSGARVFLYGRQSRELGGRCPHADIDELRAQGCLRKIRSETGNVFYAVTPAAHEERDRIASRELQGEQGARQRPSTPPPEFANASALRERLHELASAARLSLDALLDISEVVERFEPGSGVITGDPWRWGPLEDGHKPLLGETRERLDEWLTATHRVFAAVAPEHLPEFEDAAQTLHTVVVRSLNSPGPAAQTIAGVRNYAHEALERQLGLLDELPVAHRPPTTLVVTDTNALIADPDLEHWTLPEPATIVVPAQVVAELDARRPIQQSAPRRPASLGASRSTDAAETRGKA